MLLLPFLILVSNHILLSCSSSDEQFRWNSQGNLTRMFLQACMTIIVLRLFVFVLFRGFLGRGRHYKTCFDLCYLHGKEICKLYFR